MASIDTYRHTTQWCKQGGREGGGEGDWKNGALYMRVSALAYSAKLSITQLANISIDLYIDRAHSWRVSSIFLNAIQPKIIM